MTDKEILEKMHGYFLDAQWLLLVWAGQNLPKLTRDWWRDRVLPHLRPIDLNAVPDKYIPSLDKLDLSTLCKVVKLNLDAINDKVCTVTGEQRRALNEMIDVRNHWSHSGATLPKQNIVEQDVEIIRVFFTGFNSSTEDVSDVVAFSKRLNIGAQTKAPPTVANNGGNMTTPKTGTTRAMAECVYAKAKKLYDDCKNTTNMQPRFEKKDIPIIEHLLKGEKYTAIIGADAICFFLKTIYVNFNGKSQNAENALGMHIAYLQKTYPGKDPKKMQNVLANYKILIP